MKTSGPTWQTCLDQPFFGYTPEQWAWLISIDSLTQRLSQLSGNNNRIQLLNTTWGTACAEEGELLALTQPVVWIREIIHLHQHDPWIWARVVIPEDTLQKTGLDVHTSESIGHILFQDRDLKRTQLAFTLLPEHHFYCHRAAAYILNPEERLLARRSIFWFQQQPLLVVEVFLPAFNDILRSAKPLLAMARTDYKPGESQFSP